VPTDPNPRPNTNTRSRSPYASYAADAEHSAATILYALVREAGTPYHPPHGTVIQLHVEKETWRAARNWFIDINISPTPPPHSLDPTDPDQLISAQALDFLAETLHNAYDHHDHRNGWPANPDSRHPWNQVPTANQNTTRAAVQALLNQLGIQVAPPNQPPR